MTPTAVLEAAHSAGARPPAPVPRDEDEQLEPSVLARPVLVIEDQVVIAWTLETMLEEMGFRHVTVTASGPEAIEMARHEEPGLIISDINLGDSRMDGVAASTAIAHQHGSAVVFITGFASADARDRIQRDLPTAGLLRKPITDGELRRAIVALTNPDKNH